MRLLRNKGTPGRRPHAQELRRALEKNGNEVDNPFKTRLCRFRHLGYSSSNLLHRPNEGSLAMSTIDDTMLASKAVIRAVIMNATKGDVQALR